MEAEESEHFENFESEHPEAVESEYFENWGAEESGHLEHLEAE